MISTTAAAELARLWEENSQLLIELETLHPTPPPISASARLATPPPPRPKPRLSLEEARGLAARAAEMRRAPDRPEDSDA